MKAFGLADEIASAPKEGEFEPDHYRIWPDCCATLNVFIAMETQWHMVGVEGELVRTRLAYESFNTVYENMAGLGRRQRTEIFNDLRYMERAAINVINDERTERLKREAADRAANRN